MKRKIYKVLLNWKNLNDYKPLVMLGARQVGKTYVINEFCQKEFNNYVYINLFEREDIIELYEQKYNSQDKFLKLKALLNNDIERESTVLFIDEIQECEHLISELKYFCENKKIKIVCAGSLLGVKLKRAKFSFPVGKVWIHYMYPMDFEEFLWANNELYLIDEIRNSFKNNKPLFSSLHEKAMNLYRLYNISGGMPESVASLINASLDVTKYNSNILKNIIESYFKDMKKYVTSNMESLKIEKLYNSIPFQLNNQSNKFQYTKIEKNARSRDYDLVIDWLLSSNLVLKSNQVSAPLIPLKGFIKNEYFKLFISDIGILNSLLELNYANILMDNVSLYKGSITENYVANQLVSLGYSLYYWTSSGTSEIDFLLYKDGEVIPIEVKSSENTKSKSLNTYISAYSPRISYRISGKNFGYESEKNIKSIPLYAVFCI